MTSSTKDLSAGPLHKLKSAFKEIFDKENDSLTLTVLGRDKKSDSSKQESTLR